MKRKLIAFSAAVCCYIASNAQTAHYSIGTNRNEIARSIKTLPDGSSVIAGYIYDFDSSNNVTNADNLLLRVNPDGNILWQKQWGTNGDDLLYDMIITKNGDIVVVGTANRSSLYTGNNAAIYRFDATGTMLYQAFVRDTNSNTAGELYNSVCETLNGDLVAVGGHNFTPGSVDAFLSVFNSTLSNTYNEILPLSNNSDVFTSIVSDSNSVYILGYTYRTAPPTTTYYDQVVMKYNPFSGTYGSIVWTKYYDIGYSTLGKEGNLLVNSEWPTKIFLKNNKLLVSGYILDGFVGGSGTKHYLFRSDLAGNNATVNVVNSGTPVSRYYANISTAIPVTDDNIYISDVPSNSIYNPEQTGTVTGMDAWVAHVSSLTTNSISASTDFSLPGNESVMSMDIFNGGGMLNGNLFMAGNSNPVASSDNDIYFGIVAASLKDSTANCPLDSTTALDSTSTYPQTLYVPRDSFSTSSAIEVTFTNINMISSLNCGRMLNNKNGTTGIAKMNENMASLLVSPNPAIDNFNVFYALTSDVEQHVELSVVDIAGRKITENISVKEKSGILNVRLPENANPGLVICYLSVDGKVVVEKKVMVFK